jgi:hypothetical protein
MDKKIIIENCKQSDIDSAMQNWKRELLLISKEIGVPHEEVLKQVKLHIPLLTYHTVKNSSSIKFPNELKEILFKRFEGYLEKFNTYLENSGAIFFKNEESRISGKNIKIGQKNLFNINFSEVSTDIGQYIEKHLHYLRVERKNVIARFGLFIGNNPFPICYMSFCTLDRYYKALGLAYALESKIKKLEVVNLARVYGFGRLPKNSISKLISWCSDRFKQKRLKFIITAVNPLLGFNGSSMFGSGFRPFAFCPVDYVYNNEGVYISRRLSEVASERAKFDTPPNLLFVKGIGSEAIECIHKMKNVFQITSDLYGKDIPIPSEVLFNLQAKQLNHLRHELEKAWSTLTRYHGTPKTVNDPISKGQCGVTTAYLARKLKSEGFKLLFCEGNAEFPNKVSPIENHCWLKISNYKIGESEYHDLIIDLTADQSGFSEQVICDTTKNLESRFIFYKSKTEKEPNSVDSESLRRRLRILQEQLRNI